MNVDKIIIQSFLGSEAVGIYALPQKLLNNGALVATPKDKNASFNAIDTSHSNSGSPTYDAAEATAPM